MKNIKRSICCFIIGAMLTVSAFADELAPEFERGSSIPLWGVIAICIGIAIVVCIGSVYLIRTLKKKKEEGGSEK